MHHSPNVMGYIFDCEINIHNVVWEKTMKQIQFLFCRIYRQLNQQALVKWFWAILIRKLKTFTVKEAGTSGNTAKQNELIISSF